MMASSVSSACLGSFLIKIQERIEYTSCQIELKKKQPSAIFPSIF